jgi:uncharacterized protein (DUF433 family)
VDGAAGEGGEGAGEAAEGAGEVGGAGRQPDVLLNRAPRAAAELAEEDEALTLLEGPASENNFPLRTTGGIILEGVIAMLQVEDEKIPLRADKNGVLYVSGTRVTLDCVVEMFDQGASCEEIAHEYDSLKLDDVYAVITYYLRHSAEVKAYLTEHHSESEAARRQFDARFPDPLREKLRRAKRGREAGGD